MPTTLLNNVILQRNEYYKVKLVNTLNSPAGLISLIVGTKTLASFESIGANGVRDVFLKGDGLSYNFSFTFTGTCTIAVFRVRRNIYNVWDGTGLTVGFNGVLNKWMSVYDYDPEACVQFANVMASFRYGDLYLHNLQFPGVFYNKQYPMAVAVVTKEDADAVKVAHSVKVEGNFLPDWVHIRTEKPYIQSSEIISSDFKISEGMYYAKIRRDRKTPDSSTSDERLYRGDPLRGDYIMAIVSVDTPLKGYYMNAINIFYNISKGHS